MNIDETLTFVNERVRSITPYHLEPASVSIKLNQNESPYDFPPEIKEELAAFCRKRPFNRYPDFVPNDLKAALSSYTGVPADGIIAGNGSNEMLLVLLLALSGQGSDIILCQPTYTIYRLLASGLGAVVRTVFLTQDLSFDVDAICKAAADFPGSLIILCSPNNPTGCSLSEEDVRKILSVHRGFLVLDQAYVEFGGYDAIPLLKDNPNLIITRTFSKAFSGAGLRLGYMLGAPDVIREIVKIKLTYNINFFSEHAARVILGRPDIVAARVKELAARRDSLISFLRALPLDDVYDSAANFVLFRTIRKEALFVFLKTRGILVRDVSKYPMCENCLRVNVGTEKETKAFESAVRDFFNAHAS
jgi:histidinol-phosphate aminotransferase